MTTHRARGERIHPSRSTAFLNCRGSSLKLGVPPRIEIAGAQRAVGIRQRLPEDSSATAMISVAGADKRSNRLNRRGNVADPQHVSSDCGVPTSFARPPNDDA